MRHLSKLALLTAVAALTAAPFVLSTGAAESNAAHQSLLRPVIAQPAQGESYQDPTFKQTVTRLSNSQKHTAKKNGDHIVKIDYSRVQAENADGSQLLVFATNPKGFLQYALLSTEDNAIKLLDLPAGNASGLKRIQNESEARWNPADPTKIRFIKGQNSYVGGLQVYEYDIKSDKVTVLADLTGKLPKRWGKKLYGMTHFEGEYSFDGNRLAWAIENGENHVEERVGYVTFDLRDGGTVLGTLDYDDRRHNNLSISPSGNYVVISGGRKTSAFPVDFSKEKILMRESQHSDLCMTAAGQDCHIAVSFDDQQNPEYGWVYMEELGTGKRTRLVNIFGEGNTSLHISGRAAQRPGWALMSTYNCAAGDSSKKRTRLCDRVSLIELKDNPRIIPLAWTHSSGKKYYSEPQGTLSSDGSRAYFNSDWGNVGNTDTYRIDIPASIY